jgi:4-hydroxyacetophenone monooxygenase
LQPSDPAQLRRALEHADLRVLLMALYHQTGDHHWLEPPYQPRRDVELIADESAGLPPEVQTAIRDAAARQLCDPERPPAFEDPGNERIVEMMSVCLGETVSPEYGPMAREEMGFCSRDVPWHSGRAPDAASSQRVLIVGAGVSGIALGARLERLDIPYTIVERNSGIGGTWFENQYPGCGVDTPNHAYSFSMGARYRWRKYFSEQGQLLDYVVGCADEFGVRPQVRLETSLTSAHWDESRSRWEVTLATPNGEERVSAEILVSAIGQFGEPSIPRFEGAERFAGPIFHSSAWPSDLEIDGRRIALIGTGATSMQIAPALVDRVASLDLYQRSPQWARPIPRYHDPISDDAQWLLEAVPFYAAWFRFTMFWRFGDGLLPFLRKDPSWPHPERSLNRVNDRHRQDMTDHILAELGERTDLHDACIPSYPPFGKRILLDNGWYPMIQRPNVDLVTDPVERIDETGIVTRDGRHRPADVIVYATGFHMTQMTARLNLKGRDGVDLGDVWEGDNPTAYLGISVPRFPNLFLMLGPNSSLGHGGSAIFQSECQARYITSLLVQMIEGDLRSVDVKPRVHDEYNARVDAEHEQLIWTHPGMSTYYRNSRGRVFSVMPWRLVDYWSMTHDASLDDFECGS